MLQHTRENVYRSAEPISRDELRRICPAVFAERPHGERSDKYEFVPTTAILDALLDEGFEVFGAQTAGTRKADRQGFQKHLLRLRRAGDEPARVGDARPEIVLINSHDGGAAFKLAAGVFRLVCANGMVVGDTFATARVPHIGREASIGKVIEGSYEVIGEARRAVGVIEDWSARRLDDAQAVEFAAEALRLRGAPVRGDDPHDPMIGYYPEQVLRVRRAADRGSDLWLTFQRAQESLIRGGASAWSRGSNGALRWTRLRAIRSIDQSVSVNRGLWNLAERAAAGEPLRQAA